MTPSRTGLPAIFYPMIILAGSGTAAAIYIWFRQYCLLLGMHMISVGTTVAVMFTALAAGSYYFGKLADRSSNPFRLFIFLEALAGGFLIFNNLIFRIATVLYNILITNKIIGSRISIPLIFLFIPLFAVGGTMPVISRHLIRFTGIIGRKVSLIFLTHTTGILTGLLFSGAMVSRQLGLQDLQVIAALIILANTTLSYVLLRTGIIKKASARIPIMAQRVRKTALLFRKRKVILETGAKLTRAMLRVHTIQGFIISAYLVVCVRMLALYQPVLTDFYPVILVAAFLAGMLAGNLIFFSVGDRYFNNYLLLGFLEILSGLLIMLLFIILNFFPGCFTGLIYHMYQPADQSASLFICILLLVLAPGIFTGITFPLVWKTYPRKPQKIGSDIGWLGLILAAGMITGLFFSTFVLIPLTGTYYAFVFILLLGILSGVYILFRDSRLRRSMRMGFSLAAIVVFALLVFMSGKFGFSITGKTFQREGLIGDLYEGNTAGIIIRQTQDGNKQLYSGGIRILDSGPVGMQTAVFAACLPSLLNDRINNAIIIGFGLGVIPNMVVKSGVPAVHIAEMLPEIVSLSSDLFADLNEDVLTNSHVDVVIEDGRSYLYRSAGNQDLIITGRAEYDRMTQLYTTDFYRLCLNRLSEDGMLCQLVPGGNISGVRLRAIMHACTSVFPQVYLWYVSPEAYLMTAFKKRFAVDYCAFRERFMELNRDNRLGKAGFASPEIVLAHLILTDHQLREYSAGAPENSDNKLYAAIGLQKMQGRLTLLEEKIKNTEVVFNRFLKISHHCDVQALGLINRISFLNREIKNKICRDEPDLENR
jgi:spermidine synthase